MEQLVTSDFKLGIIAGGQLGEMLVLAANNWDLKTFILENDKDCPASTCCSNFVKGNPLHFNDVYNFGKMVDMVTFENVNIDALKKLKEEGKKTNPDPDILEIIQDKALQKQVYVQHDIPTSSFILFHNKEEIISAVANKKLKFLLVQKLRKGGYDGKAVAVIKNKNDLMLSILQMLS